MSGIFRKFRKDEIQITPFEANKEYTVRLTNYTGSYFEKAIFYWCGHHTFVQ